MTEWGRRIFSNILGDMDTLPLLVFLGSSSPLFRRRWRKRLEELQTGFQEKKLAWNIYRRMRGGLKSTSFPFDPIDPPPTLFVARVPIYRLFAQLSIERRLDRLLFPFQLWKEWNPPEELDDETQLYMWMLLGPRVDVQVQLVQQPDH